MTIEIRGTQTQNKGAQLMLEAIVERLQGEFRLSVPTQASRYDVRSRLGLYQTLHEYGSPRLATAVGNLMPSRYTTRYGLVRDRDISAVLDASGFAYSDSFGAERSQREALFGRRWDRRDVPKVMLPQAFGPFRDADTRRWSREVLEQADVIYARDTVSASYVDDLDISTRIEVAPDFTIGMSPIPIAPPVDGDYTAIVPNAKMIASGKIDEESYVTSLIGFAKASEALGLQPVIVVHETGDRRLAARVAEGSGSVSYESDEPRELKAVLAAARCVVTSRFHAAVGGLSKGVPTLAYGWSHKYEELLRDFDVADWMVNGDSDPAESLSALLADTGGATRLKAAARRLQERNDEMWTEALHVIRR